MNIKERAEKAVEYKHSGCNCCQAVAKACADLVNVSEEDLLKMTSGFAVGMGCMESTCGALIGAVMVAGLLKDGRGTTPVARNMLESFQKSSGALICKDLKGRDTGRVICECDDCVRNAVYALGEAFPDRV